MSNNLRHYIELKGKDRKTIAKEMGIPYSTFSDWINENRYPRIDKIEIMANYFGIEKSDLIESKEEKDMYDTEFANDFEGTFNTDRRKLWADIAYGYLSDDEFEKMTEYLKFLVSQREK